jgi:hypothetical protein
MVVNLAIQEAEIRRIVVQGQSLVNSLGDPISNIINTKKAWRYGSSGRAPEQQQ